MQKRSSPTGLSHYCSRVMPANIVEGAQNVIVAADNDHRFSRDSRSDELARRLHLIRARDELPSFAKHVEAFKLRDARIGIPGCGNRGGMGKRRVIVVTG